MKTLTIRYFTVLLKSEDYIDPDNRSSFNHPAFNAISRHIKEQEWSKSPIGCSMDDIKGFTFDNESYFKIKHVTINDRIVRTNFSLHSPGNEQYLRTLYNEKVELLLVEQTDNKFV